uniref:Endocuticle structural glycoprotein SgAbd-9 n=1 Tax=Cacopsylla melanoneura TaxID=428564 RepID=A0A8D9BJW5_9HEMI
MTSRSVSVALLSLVGVALSQVTVPPPGLAPLPFIPRPVGPVYAPGQFVPILQQNYDLNPDGSYNFGYQSADGSSRREEGVVKYPGAPAAPGFPPQGGDLAVQGNYAYISPEGANVEVSYFADENGYQPSGPGIHPAILKAVAYQVAKARAENAGQVAPYAPAPYAPVPFSPAPFSPAPFSPTAYPYPYPTPLPIVRPARSVVKASQ